MHFRDRDNDGVGYRHSARVKGTVLVFKAGRSYELHLYMYIGALSL